MSFLPHAPSRSAVWFGSLAASAITHVCITSFILFSGSVIFLRKVETLEVREPSFEITFQILDIDSIDVSIPIEEISDDEIMDKFKNIFDSPEEYIAHAAEHAKELWPDKAMKKAKKTKPK